MNSAARSRGVSLIEALVALAVMAFGLLGVVGMQATLRFNADVSRQRAEAVRMAQERMENLRAFGVLSGATVPGDQEYIDIVAGTDYPAPPTGFANTSFTRVTSVVNPTVDDPKMKSVQVAVSWLDRRTAVGGQAESVTMTSNIAEVAPELMASVGLPGDRSVTQRPLGRNRSIPVGAGPGPTGDTSNFSPPGSPTGVSWIFLNSSGRITSVCTAPGVCVLASGFLVSGYIQFINPATPPTPSLGENPNGLATSFPTISMQVALTLPIAPAVPPACYVSSATQGLAYFCFVPTDLLTGVWSGRTELTPVSMFAAAESDPTPGLYKVCRYTPSPSPTPAGGNAAHPLDYTAVNSSLTNQNFLMFTGGNGTSAYTCPGDGPSPLINSTTFRHQPSVL